MNSKVRLASACPGASTKDIPKTALPFALLRIVFGLGLCRGSRKCLSNLVLLAVRSDRLARWFRSGYLAITDAVHTMSPI